jgi:hypothetical protein
MFPALVSKGSERIVDDPGNNAVLGHFWIVGK